MINEFETWQDLAEIEADRRCLDIQTNDELYEVFMDYCNPIGHIEKLQSENEKLRNCVEYYAFETTDIIKVKAVSCLEELNGGDNE